MLAAWPGVWMLRLRGLQLKAWELGGLRRQGVGMETLEVVRVRSEEAVGL